MWLCQGQLGLWDYVWSFDGFVTWSAFLLALIATFWSENLARYRVCVTWSLNSSSQAPLRCFSLPQFGYHSVAKTISLHMHLPSADRVFQGGSTPLDHRVIRYEIYIGVPMFLAALFPMHFNFLLTFFPLINTGLAWTLCFWSGFYPIQLTYVGCLFHSV